MLLFGRPSFLKFTKLPNPSKWMSFIRQWCMFKDCKCFAYLAKARSGMYRKFELKINMDLTESAVSLKIVCNVTLEHCNRSTNPPPFPETFVHIYRLFDNIGEKFLKNRLIPSLLVKREKTWKKRSSRGGRKKKGTVSHFFRFRKRNNWKLNERAKRKKFLPHLLRVCSRCISWAQTRCTWECTAERRGTTYDAFLSGLHSLTILRRMAAQWKLEESAPRFEFYQASFPVIFYSRTTNRYRKFLWLSL